jgi:hypothetical protein
MTGVGKFYCHLVHFTAISYILWPFGIFCGHFGIFCGHFGIFFSVLVIFSVLEIFSVMVIFFQYWYFFQFWYVVPRKIWQPLRHVHMCVFSATEDFQGSRVLCSKLYDGSVDWSKCKMQLIGKKLGKKYFLENSLIFWV